MLKNLIEKPGSQTGELTPLTSPPRPGWRPLDGQLQPAGSLIREPPHQHLLQLSAYKRIHFVTPPRRRYTEGMQVATLPIFALPFVIFPGERIPFRIFEPRYKAMVADCLDPSGERGAREFGVLFATQRDNAEVGCCVKLERVLNRFPDGSLDILTRGTRRLYVQRIVSRAPYPKALVGLYDDDAFPDNRLANVAVSLHTKLIELTTEKVEVPIYEPHDMVSFLLGHNAGLTDVERQELLELRSERLRLEFLIAFYRRTIPVALKDRDLKDRVVLNGHLRVIKPAPL